ncbi:MAG: N-acetyltransferase family protein [Ruthenibacterium lactatiformans]
MPGITLRMARPEDAGGMLAVYAPYVEHSTASWEYETPSLAEFSGRLREHLDTGFPWLLAEEDGAVLGYAYAGRFAARRGYDWDAEVDIVCRRTPAAATTALYTALLALLRAGRLCFALIPHPSPASAAFHFGWALPNAPARRLQGQPVAGFLLSAHVAAASCRARAACAVERAGRRRNGTITARRGSPVPSRAGGALNGI